MAYLTKRFIDGLSPDPAKESFIRDSQLPGFGLRVKPSGRITFIIQYRNGNQSTRRMTLGKYGVVTLDRARKKAAHLLSGVSLEKSDPSAERHSSRGEISLNTLAQRYMREVAMIRKKARSYGETDISPVQDYFDFVSTDNPKKQLAAKGYDPATGKGDLFRVKTDDLGLDNY